MICNGSQYLNSRFGTRINLKYAGYKGLLGHHIMNSHVPDDDNVLSTVGKLGCNIYDIHVYLVEKFQHAI